MSLFNRFDVALGPDRGFDPIGSDLRDCIGQFLVAETLEDLFEDGNGPLSRVLCGAGGMDHVVSQSEGEGCGAQLLQKMSSCRHVQVLCWMLR